jgi:hypothetical protein
MYAFPEGRIAIRQFSVFAQEAIPEKLLLSPKLLRGYGG